MDLDYISMSPNRIQVAPLTPFGMLNHTLDCKPNHLTYSPCLTNMNPVFDMYRTGISQPGRAYTNVYLSVPEYGFSSKIASASKKKKIVPKTPAKKNKAIFGDQNGIFSPISNILKFEENPKNHKMIVK